MKALGEVFTTGQYRTAAEAPGRGVPLRLREAEQQQQVVNIKPGVWAKARPGPWNKPSVDPHVLLEAVYDGRPVRVAYRAALPPMPVATENVRSVNTPSPLPTRVPHRWGILQYREPDSTFRMFAEPVKGGVWRSTPSRALLESAQYPGRVYEPVLVMAYGMDALDPERVTEAAEGLGWTAGLQRLQSVASELRSHWQYETLGVRIDEGFCSMLRGRPRRWVHLRGPTRTGTGRTVVYADFENRVWWDAVPDVTVESFLW